ncbi:MAG TPA: PspC domain-containing protein [Bacteroidales bacterium]|nr:PspC domain-containing protein [Bacteroidales bacterium]
MKKTTQIHIGGRHFTIDEDAYQKLHHYVESLKFHFSREGETGKEIIEDIENRIAELLEQVISNGKQVVNIEDVNNAINVLGKVEDFEYAGAQEVKSEYDYGSRRNNRRFYRDPDDYYLGGVAGGLGSYFDIDPLWIRLAFVLLFFAKGAGLLVYLILWIVVPKARTTAEKLQMKGRPVNLTTIKDSVNEEYQRFRSSEGVAAARNGFESVVRAIGLVIVAIFKFIIGVIGVSFLVVGCVFLAALIMGVLGVTNVFGHMQLWDGFYMTDLHTYFANTTHLWLAIVALVVVVLIPVIALIYGGVKILFDVKSRHPLLRVFLLTGWILALVLFLTLIFVNIPNSPVEAEETNSTVIDTKKYPGIVLDASDNIIDKNITHYRIFGYRLRYSKWDDALYDKVTLEIQPSDDDQFYLSVKKRIKNVDMYDSDDYMDEIFYSWQLQDSVLFLDRYFNTDDDEFWLFAKVDLTLKVPQGKGIMIKPEVCDMLVPSQRTSYCDELPAGKKWFMSPEGALIQGN